MPWFLVIRAASLSLNFQQVAHVLFFYFFSSLYFFPPPIHVMSPEWASHRVTIPKHADGQVGGPWTNE